MCRNNRVCDCSRLTAIIGLALTLVLAASATGWGQQCCQYSCQFPPAGQVRFPVMGHTEAIIGDMQIKFDVLGPAMVMLAEPRPDPLGDIIETEMLALDLTGMSSMGQPVRMHLTPGTRSMGQTIGQPEPSSCDLPAVRSFFDVFVEIIVEIQPAVYDDMYVGLPNNQYMPVQVNSPNLQCIPPQPGAGWVTPGGAQYPLTSRTTNQQIGVLTFATGIALATNHFKTWAVTEIAPIPVPQVIVRDQFMRDVLTLGRIEYLSNPTQKDTFMVADTTEHFTWYKAFGKPTLLEVSFENQFQQTKVVIDEVHYFLTPTQKFPHNPPKLLDHYKAYRIRNPQAFTRPTVLLDQFDLVDPRGREQVDILTPRYFLTPAQKNTEPVYDTLTHYVAYEFIPKRPVTLNRDIADQFGIHVIKVDSSVFVLVPTCKKGFQPLPTGGPCCDSTLVPNCLVMCPESDIPYRMKLRDCFGNPVGGYPASQMWLDFSQCPLACPCPEEKDWPKVYPNGPSNATGDVIWYVDAGLKCPPGDPCLVTVNIVTSAGDTCRIPIDRVLSTDNNCNHVVETTDWFNDPRCNDYNCDGVVDATDHGFWFGHLGHHCKPCDQFREEIRIEGCRESELRPGDVCQVCIDIFNNTDTVCCLDSLVWQSAGFNATSTGWTEFCKKIFSPTDPGRCIPPGGTATFCCTYVVPAAGHGCVRILKFSECCDDTVQRNLTAHDDPFNCGRRCDTFRVPINVPAGAVYCVVPVENLPPGWTATYTPPLPACFPAPGPGVITVIICTDNNPLKGQQGWVTLVVTDPAGVVKGKARVCKNISCILGDADGDGILTPPDVVHHLLWVFTGQVPPGASMCLDMNQDGIPNPSDVVLELINVFTGQAPPGCR